MKKNQSAHETMPAIPRTHSAAKKVPGYKNRKFNFDALDATARSNFMRLDDKGARPGSYCGAGTDPDDSAKWLVCYKNERGSCHWVEIPKGQPIPKNDPTDD